MNLVTYFDEKSWEDTRESWLLAESSPLVFFKDLSPKSKEEVLSRFDKNSELDSLSFHHICLSLVNRFVENDQDYLLVDPRVSSKVFATNVINSYHNKDVFVNLSSFNEKDFYLFVENVFNVYEKAELIKSSKSLIENIGGLFDSSLILGSSDFWISFCGFQSIFIENDYFVHSNNFNHLNSKNFGDIMLLLFYLQSKSFSFAFKEVL